MKKVFLLLSLCLGAAFLIAGSSKPTFLFRIHLEARKGDNPNQIVRLDLGQSYGVTALREFAEISESSLQDILLRDDGSAFLIFNPGGRTRLEALTGNNQGRLICIFINGRFIYAAEVDMVLQNGRFLIPLGVTAEDVQLFREYKKSK